MEMQRKIQLLESDRASQYESSQAIIKKNTASIRQLRQENKTLFKKLTEANNSDEGVIRGAFNNRGSEKEAYRNMTGKDALITQDLKVLSKVKRLNAQKHITQTKQHHLEELQLQYQKMKPEARSGAQSADARARKEEEVAMNMRALENRLEKTQFKSKEAENIMVNYQKVKRHLQEESLTFQGLLDSLEAEILKHQEELCKMQVMNNDARISKEAAKDLLQEQEELLCMERKEREHIIAGYRRKAEEHKAQTDKVDRKRTVMQPDELSSESLHRNPGAGGEEEIISTFEEAYRRIKEATGVTNVQEILECFTSQKETYQHLLKLKEDNEKLLQQLSEHKELLGKEFQEMKYSGDAKLSSDQQMMEEQKHQLQDQQQRYDASEERLNRLVKTLATVRAGVEHLAGKLHHVTQSVETAPAVSPDSEEFVLVLLTQLDLKLQMLQRELQEQDVAALLKEMEEEEFYVRIEGKLPEFNIRIKLPEDPLTDEEEREKDEADIITREELKRQSQLIVDSKSKKKLWKNNDKF